MKKELMKLSKKELMRELVNDVQNHSSMNPIDFTIKKDSFSLLSNTFNNLSKMLGQLKLYN